MRPKASIIWFKRDLRLSDHAPLQEAIKRGLPLIPLYVVEPDYWRLATSSRRHWHFIHDSLCELQARFHQLGQPFYIRTGAVTDILSDMRQRVQIDAIYAHEETGNLWTYNRDEQVRDYLYAHHIPLHELPSAGVARRFFNRDKWAAMRNQRISSPRLTPPQSLPSPLPETTLPAGTLPAKDDPLFGAPITTDDMTQAGGRTKAISLLTSFLEHRSDNYVRHLASPSKAEFSCLRLSPHLAYGTISAREVTQTIQNYVTNPDNNITAVQKRSCRAVLSRLAWRCHFMQKLEDAPEIEKSAMHPLYEDIRQDSHNEAYLQAWQDGKTGYPLIDACMRCLQKTGWLPFRMRAMLVSFASYHLWLDWRITAPHLARLFTDYEPGIHYSQFQMQSGITGINTIRIYNPIKQTDDHDKQGTFIRKWCPELANLPAPYLSEPHKIPPFEALSIGFQIGRDYPMPIVENEQAMRHARDKIFAIRKQDGFARLAARVYQKMGSRNSPDRRKKQKPQKPETDQYSLF